jgi:hypothetical protein
MSDFIETGLRFGAERSYFTGHVNLYMLKLSEAGRHAAAPIDFTIDVRDPGKLTAPTLSLTDFEAQQLIDALWSAGLRPAGAKQSQGAYDAQSRHLEDMRALAFHHAKVERP